MGRSADWNSARRRTLVVDALEPWPSLASPPRRSTACAAASSSMAVSLRRHSRASMAVTAACIPRLTTSWLYCSVGSEWMELGPAIWRMAQARLVMLNCMPLNPELTPGSGVRLAGRPCVESIVHQHRDQRVGPVGHGGEIDLPGVQQAGDVAAVEIAGFVQDAGFGIDQRIVVGRIDLALHHGARLLHRLPRPAPALAARSAANSSSGRSMRACSRSPPASRADTPPRRSGRDALSARAPRRRTAAPAPRMASMASATAPSSARSTRRASTHNSAAHGGHHGGAVDQRQALLGREGDGLRPGGLQRLRGGHSAALEFGLAHARPARARCRRMASGRRYAPTDP